MKHLFMLVFLMAALVAPGAEVNWQYLTSTNGTLPVPGESQQQTVLVVADFDADGINDFIVGARQKGPALVFYRHNDTNNWTRYVIETNYLPLEAGGAVMDVDGDGDFDLVVGGDWQSKQVWWWENPSPHFDQSRPWVRRLIKNDGKTQHRDQIFGDFKGIGKMQLVYWNQGSKSLFLAETPRQPQSVETWPATVIFSGAPAAADRLGPYRYAEGLAAADIDGDGTDDLLAGNCWFKRSGDQFIPIQYASMAGRIRTGRFNESNSIPQIIISPGDSVGPVRLYECIGNPTNAADWVARDILPQVIHGQTLEVGDINGDGHLDIFVAEMAKWMDRATMPDNPQAKAWVIVGDGAGGFYPTVFSTGHDWHEARLVDLDGDGDLDILNKPYNWAAPRIDIWLNNGTAKR